MIDYQKIIEELLGEDYIEQEVLEDEEYIILGYALKVAVERDFDDRTPIPVGIGPILIDKRTGEYRLTGSREFIEMILPKLEIYNRLEEWEPDTMDDIVKMINKRKHINWSDFESILPRLNIPEDDIAIISDCENDIENEEGELLAQLLYVTFRVSEHQPNFQNFLNSINFPYEEVDSSTIRFYNSVDIKK